VKPRHILPALALLLSGCLQPMSDFPSLARRDIERSVPAGAIPPAAPDTSTGPVLDAATESMLTALDARAAASASSFSQAYGDADRLTRAARGAAPATEAWSMAMLALSGLDIARRDTTELLAELDLLVSDRLLQEADGKQPAGGAAQIATLRDRVAERAATQDAAIADLTARLAPS